MGDRRAPVRIWAARRWIDGTRCWVAHCWADENDGAYCGWLHVTDTHPQAVAAAMAHLAAHERTEDR